MLESHVGKEHGIVHNSIRTLPRVGWKLSWSQNSVRWPGRNHMGKGEGMGLKARGWSNS